MNVFKPRGLVLQAVFLASCVAVSGCSSAEPGANVPGGSGGSAGSRGGGSGGRQSTGGSSGTGGSASGGSAGSGSGGSASNGGSTGSGGSTSTGGSTGSGGSAGTGGSTGSGGSSGGDAGAGDTAVSGAWKYSKVITLDTTASGAGVMEDVMKYPVAVILDATRIDFAQAHMNGADIRFFDSTGKALPHHIELWDRASSSAAVWVLLDVVKGNNKDQSIVMKWGNATAPDTSDSKAVFKREDGFVGVWHLDEDGNTTANGYKDSSSHEAHGTGVAMVAGSRVNGRIGKANQLENPTGQNTARWIRVDGEKATQFNPGPPITVSIWALANSYPIRSYETIIAKGDTSWTLQKVMYSTGIGYQSCLYSNAIMNHACAYNFAGQPLVTKQWLHFMLVLQEPRQALYINGKFNAMSDLAQWQKGAHPLGIGNQTQILGGRRQWDGILDEARVMQVARPLAWAKLEFESQKENPTLLKFGETQTQ
ncbi:MAG TPA: DUF2341 domain-containing protein [Polyangia bacterium]